MATLNTSLEVCDFCYWYHQFYVKHLPFNYAQKQGVAKCSLCRTNNAMCIDCYNNSTQELEDSILVKFGLAICRKCIVDIRRTTDIQEQLEAIAEKRIQEAQAKMREDVYHLTEALQWQE